MRQRFLLKNKKKQKGKLQTIPIWELQAEEVKGKLDYSIFFLSMRGPTLSPVSSLCFKWDLSQTGNYNKKEDRINPLAKQRYFNTTREVNALQLQKTTNRQNTGQLRKCVSQIDNTCTTNTTQSNQGALQTAQMSTATGVSRGH